MRIRPGLFRHLMNLWAPFRGAGIRVEYIAPDWREVKVRLKLHWYNRNAVKEPISTYCEPLPESLAIQG